MLQLRYQPLSVENEFPLEISGKAITSRSSLLISLSIGRISGYGEAIVQYGQNVVMETLIASLQAKRPLLERYALTEPERFWHFLEHLLPHEEILVAALDAAGWDLFARMRQWPLYHAMGFKTAPSPSKASILATSDNNYAYKILHNHSREETCMVWAGTLEEALLRTEYVSSQGGIAMVLCLREGLGWEDCVQLATHLPASGIQLVEIPWNAHAEMDISILDRKNIPWIATVTKESDIPLCKKAGFDGVSIYPSLWGPTVALRMVEDARRHDLKVFIGNYTLGSIDVLLATHMSKGADWAYIYA